MDQSAAAVIDQYRDLHARLREQLKTLDLEAVIWTPGPDTSSIATLVIHMLGSERETSRSPADFQATAIGPLSSSRRCKASTS